MAERVGFEPTCRLRDKTLSRRPRYDHFGTSPVGRRNPILLCSSRHPIRQPRRDGSAIVTDRSRQASGSNAGHSDPPLVQSRRMKRLALLGLAAAWPLLPAAGGSRRRNGAVVPVLVRFAVLDSTTSFEFHVRWLYSSACSAGRPARGRCRRPRVALGDHRHDLKVRQLFRLQSAGSAGRSRTTSSSPRRRR